MCDSRFFPQTVNCTFLPIETGLGIQAKSGDDQWFIRVRNFIQINQHYGTIDSEDSVFIWNRYFEELARDSDSPDHQLDLFENLIPWLHEPLELKSHSAIGRKDFAIHTVWKDSGKAQGVFLSRHQSLFRLPYYFIEVLDALNEISRTATVQDPHSLKWRHLLQLNRLKSLAKEHPIKFDPYLASEEMIFVSEIKLDRHQQGDEVTIYPKIDGIDQQALIHAWDSQIEIRQVLSLKSDNVRTRLVFNDAVFNAAKRLRTRAYKRKGEDGALLITNPEALWDGASAEEVQCIDVRDFSSRVIGVTIDKIVAEVADKPINTQWLHEGKQNSRSEEKPSETARARLKILENDRETAYAPVNVAGDESLASALPKTLKFRDLKAHQTAAVEWIQAIYTSNPRPYHGILLADDMGLGKTLQILTFAAWAREQAKLQDANQPFTILILAPKSLHENWKHEINRFFQADAFGPLRALDGEELSDFKSADEKTSSGHLVPSLDIKKLCQDGVIFVNREQLIRYQFSLGRVDWSLMIVDEAQMLKDHTTHAKHAASAMKADFKIAVSGTPVENRLLELWSIVDFVSPGELLGNAKDFVAIYGDRKPASQNSFSELQIRLKYNSRKNDAFAIRRTKSSVGLDLPPLVEFTHECTLTDKHIDAIKNVRDEVNSGRVSYLAGLTKLATAYQHPFAVAEAKSRNWTSHQLIASCDRMRVLLDILGPIQKNNEKALIFARSLIIQDILATVFKDTLHTHALLLNGSVPKGDRLGIIDQLSKLPGFGIIIASPIVGGVGLNITEANHVIHFGRWWNPALERQATARAYRLGQKKTVNVHYIIAKGEPGYEHSFDQLLHRLHESKAHLADSLFGTFGEEELAEKELQSQAFKKIA